MPKEQSKKFDNDKPRRKINIPAGVRIPPQNVDAEKSVLGAVLLDKNALIKIVDVVSPPDFYDDNHGVIFEAMLTLFEKRQPIDIITLTEQLESEEQLEQVGGAGYLADIVNATPSAANVIHYARIVADKAVLRRLIEAAASITELGFDEDTDISDTLDKAEQSLFTVSQKFMKDKFVPVKEILTEAFDRIDKIHKDKDKGALRGVPSGFRDLDAITAGFQKSDLIILAARPSMGKTSIVLNIAEHAAIEEKIPVGIFSLEMSKEQLVDRLLSSQAAVDSWKLRTGNLSDEDFPRIGYAMGVLSEAPLYFDDTPGQNVMEIRAKARRLQMEHGLGMVIIDYLQLMEGKARSGDSNRVQEISEISRSLKGLARELNVPVIALSQLSRAVEHREDKRPQLSDLRESGCLAGDTLVYNAMSGMREKISKIVGKKDYVCAALGAYQKITDAPASKIFSTGRKKIFEIVLKSGKKIKATANHKFLTIHGWKRLDELTDTDHLATPRKVNLQVVANILNDDQIILLAHLIGDGCYLARQPLHYTNADESCLKIVDEVSHRQFGTINRLVKQKRWHHLYLSAPEKLARGKRNPVVKWLDELGIFNQRSGEKHLPQEIFSFDEEKISLFLRHLFATDGGITKSSGQWRLHYTSKSRQLIDDVIHLLLRLGIHSRIRYNRKKGYDVVYDLHVTGKEEQLKFLKKVGIFGAKEMNVKAAIEEISKLDSNTNIDIIPKEIWPIIVKKIKKNGWTTREFHHKMGWAYSGTQRYGNGISRDRMAKIAAVLNDKELTTLAESDIFWDQIKDIKPLEVEEVFDITVPELHNFTANDIIVHNSIEQDADIVMFLYRDEYYNPDTEKRGITEILVKKHRNGPTGFVEVFFQPEQMRFRDLEKRRDGNEAPPPGFEPGD